MSHAALRLLPLLLAGTAAAYGERSQPRYVRTPFGHILAHCVHEAPNGATTRELPDGSTEVIDLDGAVTIIPKCDTRDGRDAVLMRDDVPLTAAPQGSLRDIPLPPDYDGWLQYTALNTSRLGLEGGFDAFTNVMSVPDMPKTPAQILYFFPGLQNIDWVPKVDPQPTDAHPFDIIQPVLQYPSDNWVGPKSWELKSWYVTVNAGAVWTKGITGIKEGDAILCNMTRTGPTSWLIEGALKSDPKKVAKLTADHSRLKLQPWAYNTLECYGCSGCDTYPKKPITFTENKLFQAGKLIDVPAGSWAVNPQPAKKLQCGEKSHVADNGDTTISFQKEEEALIAV